MTVVKLCEEWQPIKKNATFTLFKLTHIEN